MSTLVRCCDGEWLFWAELPLRQFYRKERYNSISTLLICYKGIQLVVFVFHDDTRRSLCVRPRCILNAFRACTCGQVHRIPDLLGLWGLVGFWYVALLALHILRFGKIYSPGNSRVQLRTQRVLARMCVMVACTLGWWNTISVTLTNIGRPCSTVYIGGFRPPPRSYKKSREIAWDCRVAGIWHRANLAPDGLSIYDIPPI